ncbi:hypothetical protein JHK86_009580 [Glycine max]|nr:hypothetical protein JHK86_009580 [Glycine max]
MLQGDFRYNINSYMHSIYCMPMLAESTDITNGYLETAIDWLPGVKEILLRFTKLLQNHRPT